MPTTLRRWCRRRLTGLTTGESHPLRMFGERTRRDVRRRALQYYFLEMQRVNANGLGVTRESRA